MIRLTRKSHYWLSTIRSLCHQIVPASSTALACTSNKKSGKARDEESRRRGKKEQRLKEIRSSVKESIIKKLAAELRKEQEDITRRNRMSRAMASVANFIRQEDLSNLIEYANTFYETYHGKSQPDKFEDELCAVILNYASSVHKGDCTFATTVNEQTSFFPRFTDPKTDPNFRDVLTLMSMVPLGEQSKIAFALCLHWLDEWLRLESNSEVRDEFLPILMELKRKFSAELLKDPKQPRKNRMVFSSEEYAIACRIANMCQVDWNPDKSFEENQCDLGYSESLSVFSKGLCQAAAYGSPSDSPFVLPFKTKDDYMQLFSDQMKSEEQNFVKIQNFSRSSPLRSMEEIIELWGWRRKIKAALVEKREALGDEELKSFLEHIDLDVAADQLINCVLSILSRSQNVVSLSRFQGQMCHVLLKLVRAEFLAKMGLEHREIFEEMFSRYFEYFTGEAKSSDANCSIREWWHKCASASNLDPDFYAPFAKLITSSPDKLGSLLVSVVIDSCTMPRKSTDDAAGLPFQSKAFKLQDVSYEEESALLTGEKITVNVNMLHLRPRLISRIAAHEFENLYFESSYLPMKLPPRPWLDHGTCGPLFGSAQKIIRDSFESRDVFMNEKFSKRLLESDAQSGTKSKARLVFDSLNNLGAIPWKINKPMLSHIMKIFGCSKDLSKKELLKSLKIPAHPSTIYVTPEKMSFETSFPGKKRAEVAEDEYQSYIVSQKQFDKDKQKATRERNQLCSLHTWVLYRLAMSWHFRNDLLYFPHNMDFRGRVYPVSPFINHMGDDLNRGLLRFAKGKKLGSRGFDWLKIHCINLTGLKKRDPLKCRLEFADSMMTEIIDSAENPFEGKGWWQKSDEPWQTLAACIEIRDAIKSGDPEQFVSHLPIHQDGSCNGLQHYAALGRDYEGAIEVNLVPNNTPMDVYSSVCERAEKMRLEDEQDDSSMRHDTAALRKAMPKPITRKLLKQTVMTTVGEVYGVTLFGAQEQIKRQLRAMDIVCEKKFPGYLAKNAFASLDKAFATSMMLKKWFQECAAHVSKLHQTMQWETPLGMPVCQPYLNAQIMSGHLYLAPIRSKQVNAFPPNFVHSLDSTHMMLTTLFCHKEGLTFAAVHDCFWTHACDVDRMNEICRDQFVALHEYPIIENLSKFLIKTYVDELPISEEDKELMSQMFISRVMPGTLDIKDIRNSTYFFS